MKTIPKSLLLVVAWGAAACEPSIEAEDNGTTHFQCLEMGPAEGREDLVGGSTSEAALEATLDACLAHYTVGSDAGDTCPSNSWCPGMCDEAALISQEVAKCIATEEGLAHPLNVRIMFAETPPEPGIPRIVWEIDGAEGALVVVDARVGAVLLRGAVTAGG